MFREFTALCAYVYQYYTLYSALCARKKWERIPPQAAALRLSAWARSTAPRKREAASSTAQAKKAGV